MGLREHQRTSANLHADEEQATAFVRQRGRCADTSRQLPSVYFGHQ